MKQKLVRIWAVTHAAARKAWALAPDRWTVVEGTGAGLLGGGVWAQWGAPWACMLWGSMLLAVAVVRELRLATPKEE